MRDAAAALALVAAIAVVALVRPPAPRLPPPRQSAAACAPWMADAIPGVGPRTREAVAERIRAGEVPAAAADWFER